MILRRSSASAPQACGLRKNGGILLPLQNLVILEKEFLQVERSSLGYTTQLVQCTAVWHATNQDSREKFKKCNIVGATTKGDPVPNADTLQIIGIAFMLPLLSLKPHVGASSMWSVDAFWMIASCATVASVLRSAVASKARVIARRLLRTIRSSCKLTSSRAKLNVSGSV